MWIALALAAPLDADAIQALIARDELARAPYDEACCGEGGIGLTKVRWAELTGAPPEELVLTMQEYIGEGCADDHHHVYDVSGPEPVALGTLSHGGYATFPYLEITDLDHDGVHELFSVGPASGDDDPSPLTLHRVKDGALVQHGATATSGRVYLPWDVDRDGLLDIVALHRHDGQVLVDVLGRDARSVVAPPARSWLPSLFQHRLTHDPVPRSRDTLTLLSEAMAQRGLTLPNPDAAFASVVQRLADTPERADPYVDAVDWAGAPAQRALLVQLLADPERAPGAARLLLRTPGDHGAALAWVDGKLKATAAGDGEPPHDSVLVLLDDEARQITCTLLQQLVLGDSSEQGRGRLAWALGAPLWCVEATLTVLGTEDVPRQVLRGAIHAVDSSSLHDDAREAFAARSDRLGPPLLALLQGDDPGLAAEAARALGAAGQHGEALRRALLVSVDTEEQRSILVGIDDLDDPGGAALYLQVLARTHDTEVRRRLHGQLARMADPADVQKGLDQVRSEGDYSAYHWRAVYRTASLSSPVRAVLRADAGARLADPEPRVRQDAAQVLGAIGARGHEAALKAVAEGDDEVEWVREAAQEALDAQR